MNKLRKRKFTALLSPIAAVGLFAAAGQAQTTAPAQPADEEAQVLEKFVVTGSNIPMAADALAVPVTILGPAKIESTGVSTNVLDVLRKAMPQFSGSSNIGNENANIDSANTMGGSSLALHNLNTLVLIDGRRVAFSPANAQGGAQFVDVNMIPLAAIERIEVLSDGASAIYGSDAIAGVVNIILKSDYQGAEIGGHYGVTNNKGHYSERSASVVVGATSGKTSVTVSAQYSKTDPILQYQRDFSNPIYGTTYYPGVIDIYDLATSNDLYYILKPGLNAPPGGGTATIDDLVASGVYTQKTANEVTNGFNLAQYPTLRMQQKRTSATVDLNHKIFGDNFQLFGNLIYSNTYSESQLNGQPVYPNVSTPYNDPYWNGDSPPPPGSQYLLATSANNPFSAIWLDQGAPEDYTAGYIVTAHNRFFEFPRVYQNDTTLIRGVVGLKGKINENYSWEVAGNFNRISLDYHNPGVINTANFVHAMNVDLLNPFAVEQPAGVLDGVIGTAQADFLSTLNGVDIIFRGTPFDLPGGKIGFAVGANFHREHLDGNPDINSIPNADGLIGWTGATSLSPFSADRKVKAVFAEVNVPIVSPAQGIPAVYSLGVDVAGRYEDYTDAGSSRVPKISVRYQPIDTQLTFRASAGKAFSAPDLYSLFGPTSTGFTNGLTFDNYGGGQTENVQFQVAAGSNPDLRPSTANTWTLGVVYSPKQVKGLDLTFDYFETVQKGLIGSFGDLTIAQDVELNGPASPYAQYVHIGGLNGTPITAPGQLSTTAPSSIYFYEPLVNLAAQAVRGFDAGVEYKLDLDAAGTVDLASNVTVYNSYRVQALPTEDYYQYAGHATGGGNASNGTLPRWRTYTTANWQWEGIGFLVAHTYIPSVTDIGPGGISANQPVDVGSYQAFDLAASYDFGRLQSQRWLNGLSMRIGVNNVFNKMPPLAPQAFPDNNVDLGTYSDIGRFFYVDLRYKF